MAAVVRFLAARRERSGQREEEQRNTYARIVDNSTLQIIECVIICVKNRAYEEVTVEENALSSRKKRTAVKRISLSATNASKLPSMNKTTISNVKR